MKDPHFNGRLTKNVNIAGKDVKIYPLRMINLLRNIKKGRKVKL